MDKFRALLDDKISEILEQIDRFSFDSLCDEALFLLSEENIWNLSRKDFNRMKDEIFTILDLSLREVLFINSIVILPDDVKEYKKTTIGLTTIQKNLLNVILLKIQKEKLLYSDEALQSLYEKLEEYKILKGKLNKNKINLITEFDLIKEILDDNSVSFEEQIAIYKGINNINSNIYNNYKKPLNGVIFEEQILKEEDLTETNMNPNDLDNLLKEFGIDWKYLKAEGIQDQKVGYKLNQLRDKLLKYGNYEKMKKLLSFIKNEDLSFVFSYPEVICKTLLYSSATQLENLINVASSHDINHFRLLNLYPTSFYPAVEEKKMTKTSTDKTVVTGALNNFIDNVSFFDEIGYPASLVFTDNSVVLTKSSKILRENYNKLNLYGISLKYEDGTNKLGASILATLGSLDNIDIAIESNCYAYISDNLSRIKGDSNQFYKIKLALSKGVQLSEIFGQYNKSSNHRGYFLTKKFNNGSFGDFGKNIDDTYKLYEALEPNIVLKKEYEDIIKHSGNDVISNVSLQDSLILKLDKNYLDRNNPLVYNFNGVVISRFKVLRYFETLLSNNLILPQDALLYCITLNSMLNYQEYSKVRDCVENICAERGMRR